MSRGLDMLGVDYGSVLSTVFQAAGGAVDYAQHSQEDSAAAANASSVLMAAIVADHAATAAVAKASMSALVAKATPSKASSSALKADKAAADNALAAQDKAGAAVSEEQRADRVKAAQDAVDIFTRKVSATSGSTKVIAQAQLDAAKQTLSKISGNSKDDGSNAAPVSFFARPIVWLAGVLAVVGAAVAYKKYHH